MSKFLKVLAALFLCIGIIASFVLAFNFGYDYPYSFLKEINIPRFLGILVGGILTASVTFGVLYFFGEVLDKLDEILYWLKNHKQD